jgi:hypothetical protein
MPTTTTGVVVVVVVMAVVAGVVSVVVAVVVGPVCLSLERRPCLNASQLQVKWQLVWQRQRRWR